MIKYALTGKRRPITILKKKKEIKKKSIKKEKITKISKDFVKKKKGSITQ
jgi:hypothetical protein